MRPFPNLALPRRARICLRAVARKLRLRRRRIPPGDTDDDPQPVNMPYVPPEVWGIVIQHACLLYHDPLDTSSQLSFLESPSTQLATYRATMRIKLALSLVSKQWNDLARPFLYEFVWISHAAQAKSLALTLLLEFIGHHGTSGAYLRRLHIETPALERCAPADLRTILEFAPHLRVYADHASVQRNVCDEAPDPRCSPEEILRLVAHPLIRQLSWTCYDAVPFRLCMSPLATNLATNLEYLELASCAPGLLPLADSSVTAPAPTPAAPAPGAAAEMTVCLPALRALKVSLDNDTFAALAAWDMPRLAHLSVLSADFRYAGPGFARFFAAHGRKLRQLELGHSPSRVAAHYLTARAPHPAPAPLAAWCPRLRELVCSADAAWHWRAPPDWTAPHVLLPAHPAVELIGVRDIDARLRADADAEADAPFSQLHAQLAALLRAAAFPRLRFVRDLSAASHRMRTERPSAAVTRFWSAVVRRCQEREVWLEDYTGVNITLRGLQRASLCQA
ncbi:hypothetical protein AcV5_003106 [Taiwanofungus camphoratus]|nr:hypothetical protein AcV5_003106 [Antrodia cinnamomea]